MSEQALINGALEDALAHATTEDQRTFVLRAALMTVAGYLREQEGTSGAASMLRSTADHLEQTRR